MMMMMMMMLITVMMINIQFYYGEKAPLSRKAFENLLKEIYPDIGKGFGDIALYSYWFLELLPLIVIGFDKT